MIRAYRPLTGLEAERAGSVWLSCDAHDCPNEAVIEDVSVSGGEGNTTLSARSAPMPDGWRTDDPSDNALAGAAQFCPTHASVIPATLDE